MVVLDSTRLVSVRLVSVRFVSVRFGATRLGSVRLDSTRFGSVRLDPVRCGSARFGAVRLASAQFSSGVSLAVFLMSICAPRGMSSIDLPGIPLDPELGLLIGLNLDEEKVSTETLASYLCLLTRPFTSLE